jgi:predicted HAD superfamily phosphohydrolase YqeG
MKWSTVQVTHGRNVSISLTADNEEKLNEKIRMWMMSMEGKDLKVNIVKYCKEQKIRTEHKGALYVGRMLVATQPLVYKHEKGTQKMLGYERNWTSVVCL